MNVSFYSDNVVSSFVENMDAFGDNFVEPAEVDPAAEFLAREQNELAGLEVEIPPMTNVAPISIDDGKLIFLFIYNSLFLLRIF